MTALNNQSSNTFSDISSEAYRTYTFDTDREVTIKEPTHLSVSPNGHRLFDKAGVSHYIPKGWIHLKWEAKAGQPHFVK